MSISEKKIELGDRPIEVTPGLKMKGGGTVTVSQSAPVKPKTGTTVQINDPGAEGRIVTLMRVGISWKMLLDNPAVIEALNTHKDSEIVDWFTYAHLRYFKTLVAQLEGAYPELASLFNQSVTYSDD